MSTKHKKLASKIFEANPKENKLYIVEDGTPFFLIEKAVAYSDKKKFEKEPEFFFRDGVHIANVENKDSDSQNQTITKQQIKIDGLEAENKSLKQENESYKQKVSELEEVILKLSEDGSEDTEESAETS